MKDAYSMRLKLDTVQLIRRRVILMSVVSGKGSAPVESPREDLFVVSKVAAEHKTYEQAMAGIDETLKKMGLYYQDFLPCFLHFKLSVKNTYLNIKYTQFEYG